jgi:hypothetical protein
MYMCYLLSCALNVSFNMPAAFDPAEMRLPLPCDDVAGDAQSEESLARTARTGGAANIR